MEEEKIEFYKHVKEMIDLDFPCFKMLEEINRQPEEIIFLIPETHLETLRSNKLKVFKYELSKVPTGVGYDLEKIFEALKKDNSVLEFNDFDLFLLFIMGKLEEAISS